MLKFKLSFLQKPFYFYHEIATCDIMDDKEKEEKEPRGGYCGGGTSESARDR